MKRMVLTSAMTLLGFTLGACGDNRTKSSVQAPGQPETIKTQVLEAGAIALQNKPPVEALNAYLDGFHFYNGRPDMQIEAHHYCSLLNEDVTQCVIYDGNQKDAKIMGVEYIVSAGLFAGLPPEEKALWHSHVHEVKSGQLLAPGIPEIAEKELMKKLVGTYGKTWHTWHTDAQKTLPLGVPQLMMGFTADGQADPAMVAARDKRFGIDSAARKKSREDIASPTMDPGADAWQQGKVVQIPDPTGSQHAHENATRGPGNQRAAGQCALQPAQSHAAMTPGRGPATVMVKTGCSLYAACASSYEYRSVGRPASEGPERRFYFALPVVAPDAAPAG